MPVLAGLPRCLFAFYGTFYTPTQHPLRRTIRRDLERLFFRRDRRCLVQQSTLRPGLQGAHGGLPDGKLWATMAYNLKALVFDPVRAAVLSQAMTLEGQRAQGEDEGPSQ